MERYALTLIVVAMVAIWLYGLIAAARLPPPPLDEAPDEGRKAPRRLRGRLR